MISTTDTKPGKTTFRRALAASAAVTGVGAAVAALPAQPASAHETVIPLMLGNATVGAGHAGIRVCSVDPDLRIYQARWWSPGATQEEHLVAPINGGCNDYVDPDGIARYRLCVIGHGCTGWKQV